MAQAESTASDFAGRDGHGRFAKGNPGGPGRKPRATESAYLATLADVCDIEVWRGICARAVQDALNGDRAAREWIAGYLLGRPGAEAPSLRKALDPDAERRGALLADLEEYAHAPVNARPPLGVLEAIAAMDADGEAQHQ